MRKHKNTYLISLSIVDKDYSLFTMSIVQKRLTKRKNYNFNTNNTISE